MGICSSSDSTCVGVATAKLILEDGRLQEYPYPVKVSFLLQKNPASFICNSDEMAFDDVVSPVGDDEELQLGQLYFALPLSRLKRRLPAEDMAALAVKASSALASSSSANVAVFSGKKQPAGSDGQRGLRRRIPTADARRRGKFTARLSVIPE